MSGRFRTLDQVISEWGIADTEEDHRRAVRWLSDQIRAGRIVAHKFGRSWRMDESDMKAALEVVSNRDRKPVQHIPVAVGPVRRGLSAASLRRRSA